MKYNKNEVTGKMRDRIILQNVNRSRSLTGFASESWADVATIWAFAESKLPGSNETIIEGKNTAKNICDFTIRYISSITEESRVVWGDKLYQVKNLKVSHDRRFISFQGVFYDSYILTGVNVAASVNGIATTSANLKLIMSVIGQANAIASAIGDLTVFQEGLVEVTATASATATTSANVTKVISISGDLAGSAFVDANASIVQNISASVQTDANISAELKLTKTLVSSVNATATAASILDVVTQGIVLLDASVTATGTTTANLSRIATLVSSPSTAADTSAIATLTKVLEASATATANTDASAQLTIPVNASATATAETSANAQLSYTVNAEAMATAESLAEAQIVRIISASATAMAESSAEASFGVTFVASVQGMATVDNATIARAATMVASVTCQANVTAATLTTVDNVAASVNAAATVTNATLYVQQPLLLDLYPSATVAYSLRKLSNAYTGSAIRVRRSSDNTEQDIGFDANGNLDTSALTTFVGANNGFVRTWYDQSGNSRNAEQTTSANQPQIVSSGSVLLLTSKPTMRFDGVNDSLITAFFAYPASMSLYYATQRIAAPTTGDLYAPDISIRPTTLADHGAFHYVKSNLTGASYPFFNSFAKSYDGLGIYTNGQKYIINFELTSNIRFDVYKNNALEGGNTITGSISTASQGFVIGNQQSPVRFTNNNFSEIILWPTNQSSNRSVINSNINSYHGVY